MAPQNLPARPSTDYAKESLFNILQHEIQWPSTKMIDLFAGIGSISLEALSRGASYVWSVDQHPGTIKWLQRITHDLKVDDRPSIVRGEALRFIQSFRESVDLIFADPPYDYADYDSLIESVLTHDSFNDSLFVLEHRKTMSFQEHPNFVDERTYGEARFTFLRNEP